MLIETKEAVYKIERGTNRHNQAYYIVERVGCLPQGADLPEKVSFEGNLIVFTPQGELALFQGDRKDKSGKSDRRVLKTAPIVFPEPKSTFQT